jgi:hypothetical protein
MQTTFALFLNHSDFNLSLQTMSIEVLSTPFASRDKDFRCSATF